MTPTEEKALAEKAAKFLGLEKLSNGLWILQGEGHSPIVQFWRLDTGFFEDIESAPILAHLACEKMEKRLWEYSSSYDLHGFGKKIYAEFTFKILTAPLCETHKATDKNKFKALYLAIEKTGLMG